MEDGPQFSTEHSCVTAISPPSISEGTFQKGVRWGSGSSFGSETWGLAGPQKLGLGSGLECPGRMRSAGPRLTAPPRQLGVNTHRAAGATPAMSREGEQHAGCQPPPPPALPGSTGTRCPEQRGQRWCRAKTPHPHRAQPHQAPGPPFSQCSRARPAPKRKRGSGSCLVFYFIKQATPWTLRTRAGPFHVPAVPAVRPHAPPASSPRRRLHRPTPSRGGETE